MSFSVIDYIFGKALDTLLDHGFREDLERSLNKAVRAWAKGLPSEFYVHDTSLFPVQFTNELDAGEAARVVCATLKGGRLVKKELWYAALVERWQAVRSLARREMSVQPLYSATEAQAFPLLEDLAESLERCCITDSDVFRNHVVEKLSALSHHGLEKAFAADLRADVQLPLRQALQQNKNEKALKIAQDIIDNYPETVRARYNYAVAASRIGAHKSLSENSPIMILAKTYFEEALKMGALRLLLHFEQISEPRKFILKDHDLAFLFTLYPELKSRVRESEKELVGGLGTRNYSGGCFVASTHVFVPGGTRVRIDSMSIGDSVQSLNAEQKLSASRVANIYRGMDATITLNGVVQSSRSQPFYVLGRGWVQASEVECGNRLRMRDGGELLITETLHDKTKVPVYGLTTEPDHTYYANGVLAHNKMSYDKWLDDPSRF